MLTTGRYVEYVYEGPFDYERFCREKWTDVYRCIRFPKAEERDPDFEYVWEDLREDDMYPEVKEMFKRMGIDRLDGKTGFTFMDQLGYVECFAELGDDGKSYCTASLAVDGILCIRPAEP